MGSTPAVLVHGHFYQPPRENPWTGAVEREGSAAPAHDWNSRIHDECYRPNAYARIFDEAGRVHSIVNNYEHISFNFGPTLMAWLAQHQPATLKRIVAADQTSRRRFGGHGNALAQAYNHTILPLMNRRDIRTQIRWGKASFAQHFGREAEGMWLPESACSQEVIQVLIEEGLRFVILAPRQAARLLVEDETGKPVWRDVRGRIDSRVPYRCRYSASDNRSLVVFFYHGEVSQAVAFEGLLHSSQALVERMANASRSDGGLVQVVTDGESYGHHHRYGERCLAHALVVEAARRGLRVSNYGAYLEEHPPQEWVEIDHGEDGLGSSWSCAHGVGRWQRDCGCQTGGEANWNQRWRGPLRAALDRLHAQAADFYGDLVGDLVADPWKLRDDLVDIAHADEEARREIFGRHAGRPLSSQEQMRVMAALRMQHSSMLMFTSCAWFFNDLSGIETVQNLRYAACLLDQIKALGGTDLEATFVADLAEAKSNVASEGTGADIYRTRVAPSRVSPSRLAAHVAMAFGCQMEEPCDAGDVGDHRFRFLSHAREKYGAYVLTTGSMAVVRRGTSAEDVWSFYAAVGLEQTLTALVQPKGDGQSSPLALAQWVELLDEAPGTCPIAVASKSLGPGALRYGVDALLASGQEAWARSLLRGIKERHATFWKSIRTELPQSIELYASQLQHLDGEFAAVALLLLQHRLDALVERPLNQQGVAELQSLLGQAKAWNCNLSLHGLLQRMRVDVLAATHALLQGAEERPYAVGEPVAAAQYLLRTADELGLRPQLERAQELIFESLSDGNDDPRVQALAGALGLATADSTDAVSVTA